MQTPENVRRFYQSKLWKHVRAKLRYERRGLCEECGKAGWEVHHIIPLTESNVDDPNISINEKNLMLLCTSCHDAKRATDAQAASPTRPDVSFDAEGNLIHSKEFVQFNGSVYAGHQPYKLGGPPRSKN